MDYSSLNIQIDALMKGVDVLVATPGRLVSLLKNKDVVGLDDEDLHSRKNEKSGVIDLSQVRMFILDEVDRMLDLGHMPDLVSIFKSLPKPRSLTSRGEDPMQVMMFSATIMPRILDLVSRFAPRNEKIDLNWDFNPPESSTFRRIHSCPPSFSPSPPSCL